MTAAACPCGSGERLALGADGARTRRGRCTLCGRARTFAVREDCRHALKAPANVPRRGVLSVRCMVCGAAEAAMLGNPPRFDDEARAVIEEAARRAGSRRPGVLVRQVEERVGALVFFDTFDPAAGVAPWARKGSSPSEIESNIRRLLGAAGTLETALGGEAAWSLLVQELERLRDLLEWHAELCADTFTPRGRPAADYAAVLASVRGPIVAHGISPVGERAARIYSRAIRLAGLVPPRDLLRTIKEGARNGHPHGPEDRRCSEEGCDRRAMPGLCAEHAVWDLYRG